MKDDVRPPQVSFICVVVLRTNRDWVVAWIIPKAVVEDRPLNAAITTLIILALCQGRAPSRLSLLMVTSRRARGSEPACRSKPGHKLPGPT